MFLSLTSGPHSQSQRLLKPCSNPFMIPQIHSIQEFLPGYGLPPVPRQGSRILLLRHGRSTLNDQGCYQGSSDHSDLTSQGRAAAQVMGRYLARCPIDAIYVSPLKRAQATAAALLPYLQPNPARPVRTSDLIREIDLPAWEGQRYEAVRSQQPEAYRCWQESPDQFQMPLHSCSRPEDSSVPTFYPVRDLYARVRQFWMEILPHHLGQTLLVVSHGGTNQALINSALRLPSCRHHALQQTHGGLSILDFEPLCQQARLHLLNLTLKRSHTFCLPKLKAGKQGLRILLFAPVSNSIVSPALLALLQREPLHTTVVEASYRIPQAWLKQHPEPTLLSVPDAQFWQKWQTTFHDCLNQYSPSRVLTILGVAPPATLQRVLATLLSWPSYCHDLALKPDSLTVVHYPDPQAPPILQGMNLAHH